MREPATTDDRRTQVRPVRLANLIVVPIVVLIVTLIVAVAGCGNASDDPASRAAAVPGSPPPASTRPASSPVTTTGDVAIATTRAPIPLPEMFPTLTVAADGVAMADLPLRFDRWGDEGVDPPDRDPSRAIVVPAGSSITLRHALADRIDLEVVQLVETSRFAALERTVVSDGSRSSVVLDTPGTHVVSALAHYQPSDGYAGTGTLRAAVWVQVVPSDAGCIAAGASVGEIGGLVDSAGCPVPTEVAHLELATGLPWFHCAPWPPVLSWPGHPEGTGPSFVRTDIDTVLPNVVDVPADAETSGVHLPAGAVATSPSDPASIFVLLDDGTAERWPVWLDDYGCA